MVYSLLLHIRDRLVALVTICFDLFYLVSVLSSIDVCCSLLDDAKSFGSLETISAATCFYSLPTARPYRTEKRKDIY